MRRSKISHSAVGSVAAVRGDKFRYDGKIPSDQHTGCTGHRLSVTETAPSVILCCEARTTLKVQARIVLNEFLRSEECTAEEVVMPSTQESSNIFPEIGSKKGSRDCTALAA